MKTLIVYASLTGNTENLSNLLYQEFQRREVTPTIRECTQINADDCLNYDICVIATYTWGREGELPDEMVGFYEDLGKLDLSGKIFGTLGTGEEAYGFFCKSVDDFNLQFKNTGARKGAESIKIEAQPKESDIPKIRQFVDELIRTYNSR